METSETINFRKTQNSTKIKRQKDKGKSYKCTTMKIKNKKNKKNLKKKSLNNNNRNYSKLGFKINK